MPEILKIFPNSSLDFIQSGHLVHVEKPQDFLNKSVSFINS